MVADANGWADEPEDEREQRQAWEDRWDLPDELPAGARDPWDEWPESECSAEYWIYKRIRDEGL